jgi:predicted  nucleic acid-binding Zn-ribbon protein
MTRMVAIAVGAALVGVLAGFLWWGTAANRLRDDVRALQNRQADADATLKDVQGKLKKTEDELQVERERRARLELVLSQGRK